MKEKVRMSIEEAERLSIMRQVDKKTFTLKKASENFISEKRGCAKKFL